MVVSRQRDLLYLFLCFIVFVFIVGLSVGYLSSYKKYLFKKKQSQELKTLKLELQIEVLKRENETLKRKMYRNEE